MKCEIESHSAEQTETIAAVLGSNLKGGEVIELISDLGGGKTTFVKGLAKGFGSDDRVASPTFTLSKVYKAGNKELHHFDFYRLTDAGIMVHEINELIGDPEVVLVIEWAQAVRDVLPEARITITLTLTGDDSRKLLITCPDNLKYAVEGLC